MTTKTTKNALDLTTLQMNIISNLVPEDYNSEFWKNLNARKGEMDIKISINGFKFDFQKFADLLEEEYDKQLEEKALEIMKNLAYGMKDKMEQLFSKEVENVFADRSRE